MGKGFEGSNDLRVEYHPLSVLVRAPRNPKTHDLGALSQSFRRFGYIAPMVLNETTGRLVVGHGRLDALQQAKAAGQKPPARVKLGPKGEWLVPVIRGVAFKTDQEAEAYLIADNQHTLLGAWDDTQLSQVLADLATQDALTGTGFDRDDVDALLRQVGGNGMSAPEPRLDQAKALQKQWQTALGQLWEIRGHRLLCGDAANRHDVARLMGSDRAGLMNTDPPYGVAYANEERPRPGVAKPRVAKPRVAKDDLRDEALQQFLESVFSVATGYALKPTAAWYLWHAHLTQGFFAAAAAAAADVILHRQIIWVKPVLLLGRGHYHWKHEPCFMGWVKGHGPPDYGRGHGERDQTTVWEVASVSQSDRRGFNHATPKPVGLFSIPLVKHLKAGAIAYEPFAGSGPQFVAAELLHRRCFGLEIEPSYVAVTLQRLADMGLTPKLVDG